MSKLAGQDYPPKWPKIADEQRQAFNQCWKAVEEAFDELHQAGRYKGC
jgi:hypothetical protein